MFSVKDFSEVELKSFGWKRVDIKGNKGGSINDFSCIVLRGGWYVSDSDIEVVRFRVVEENGCNIEYGDIISILRRDKGGIVDVLEYLEDIGYYGGKNSIDYEIEEGVDFSEGDFEDSDSNEYKLVVRDDKSWELV